MTLSAMNLLLVGCSHHRTPLAVRERLAFDRQQTVSALMALRGRWPETEAVLLSTCNRVELYLGGEKPLMPSAEQAGQFLAHFHGLDPTLIQPYLYAYEDEEAARHLFAVASSLDSMVLGEAQILGQVKEAYQLATQHGTVGPILHAAFQTAVKVARRVASETSLHQRRVSIPSVAVADFAQQVFDRFDDKQVLVIGAGQMAEETLKYLQQEGARHITVVNRSLERAEQLACLWHGRALPWDQLATAAAGADVIICTTGAQEPILTLETFQQVAAVRRRWPVFILDLAVPRDVDPAIGNLPGVYLFSIDDLKATCEANRRQRDAELPAAWRIIEEETGRFMADLHHKASAPLILQLRQDWQRWKEQELQRLLNKLPQLDEQARSEIRQAFDRLVNKMLHLPLDTLRDQARHGVPYSLMDALAKLFRLKD
ncbi:MAG: glutamyl-tRNA reductase [Thermoguttaceae bacterium]|nr:glutamyl-tRNA reductase [Thermoguttaceae bacterium]MDW8037233.1 glutamyl-tRNA reductase [Thermoguttaceae bacterium]